MGISDLNVASLLGRISQRFIRTGPAAFGTALSRRSPSFTEEQPFKSFLFLERRRAERSRKPFALMLLDGSKPLSNGSAERILGQILAALISCIRETDVIGWYKSGEILGVIFTEINPATGSSATEELRLKIEKALHDHLGSEQGKNIAISIHVFPRKLDRDNSGPLADSRFYPDLEQRDIRNRGPLMIKRAIDIVSSGLFLILFSPLFAIIALAIKFSSKGPVLFRQERLGQFGARFQLLKFRTMYANNDPKIHQEYAQRIISGKDDCAMQGDGGKAVYKITRDPRVTPFGRWLRRTSLDELPQFWNVLRGDMSLVGPRPPLLYEFVLYDLWHQRRVLEVKPGITGLWQVSGRNRIKFDEMVRLDLQYYRSWSIWLDVKILLRTPFVVIFGDRAY